VSFLQDLNVYLQKYSMFADEYWCVLYWRFWFFFYLILFCRIRINRNSILIINPREQDSGLYSCHKQNQYGEVWKNYSVIVNNGMYLVVSLQETKFSSLRRSTWKFIHCMVIIVIWSMVGRDCSGRVVNDQLVIRFPLHWKDQTTGQHR
jgi:hypothetical protein